DPFSVVGIQLDLLRVRKQRAEYWESWGSSSAAETVAAPQRYLGGMAVPRWDDSVAEQQQFCGEKAATAFSLRNHRPILESAAPTDTDAADWLWLHGHHDCMTPAANSGLVPMMGSTSPSADNPAAAGR
ncbi:hypothetical protein HK405_010476, partial [Cladochytrium tenue]